jgi:hypothetical protein
MGEIDVINSYSTGTISGITDIGGLVGNNNGGEINSCYSTCNVSGTGDNTGGLVGINYGIIDNSYSTGDIMGGEYVGGLAGDNDNYINDSYSTGTVSGTTSSFGGLIGINWGTISSSYWFDWPGDNATQCYSGGDTGCIKKNTTITYFYNVDNPPMNKTLGNSWQFPPWDDFCNNSGYPPLAWQGLTNVTQCEYTPSVCGNNLIESGEDCDGGICCSDTCTFNSSANICRTSEGICDIADHCTGSSATCPYDQFNSSETLCRPNAGVCDAEEFCTGYDAACPEDVYNSTDICRNSTGYCDPAEYCNGTGITCPTDIFTLPNLVNTSWSAWYNISECYENNLTVQQERNRTQYDNNSCGGANTTFYEYRWISCESCITFQYNTSWSAWYDISECYPNSTLEQERNATQYSVIFCPLAFICTPNNSTTIHDYQWVSCGGEFGMMGQQAGIIVAGGNIFILMILGITGFMFFILLGLTKLLDTDEGVQVRAITNRKKK